MFHLATGDIAQLVELRSCNWVVAITGWMSNCPGGNDSILYLTEQVAHFFRSNGEEDQVGPCEQLDALSPPLSEMRQKENPWPHRLHPVGTAGSPLRRLFESCKLCSGGSYCLSLASMVESVGDRGGGGLPCGGCQRFESAYLQLVNLANTKLYDKPRFGGSIYDF